MGELELTFTSLPQSFGGVPQSAGKDSRSHRGNSNYPLMPDCFEYAVHRCNKKCVEGWASILRGLYDAKWPLMLANSFHLGSRHRTTPASTTNARGPFC